MTVQDAVRTLPLPRPAEPARPLVAVRRTAPAAPLVGRDRPMTSEERHFLIGLGVMLVVLSTIIVGGLLLSQYVWG